MAIVWCHMIIIGKPHGMNLIDAMNLYVGPRNHSMYMYARPFPSLMVESRNETKIHVYLELAAGLTSKGAWVPYP